MGRAGSPSGEAARQSLRRHRRTGRGRAQRDGLSEDEGKGERRRTPGRRARAAIFLHYSSFPRLVLPPRGKERRPRQGDAGKDAKANPRQGGTEGLQVTDGAGQHTHKKGSGVVSGQGQIPASGNRSRAVPRRHFLPHSNPLCPPNMAASPRRRLLLPPQARSSAGHPSRWASRALEEHAKPRRTAARRAAPAPAGRCRALHRRRRRRRRPRGARREAVGAPALTSCSTRGSSAPREKRK